MKKLIFALLLLPFITKAQVKTKLYVGGPLATNVYRGPLGSDSALYIMAGCDSPANVNVNGFYGVYRGALIYKDTCNDAIYTSNPDESWTRIINSSGDIFISGDTLIVNKIRIKNLLSIPLTDTTNAIKGCGNMIYDTINEHFYGDVCINGTHYAWQCFDCVSGTGTVTSVGLSAPTIFTVSGSPVTTTGTLTFTPNNATGDIIYGSGTNTLAYRNIGTTGQKLTVVGGLPVWVDSTAVPTSYVSSWSGGTTGMTPNTATTGAVTMAGTLGTANGGTNITSYTTGDLLYASSSSVLSKLPIGTSSQHLVVVGGLPAWRDTAAAGTSYTANNGITLTANNFQWGGPLVANTTITGAGFYSRFSGGRLQAGQGAAIAAANDLTLGNDGNTFSITGATQINAITSTNWQGGSVVNLIFASTPTVKHNTAGGAGTAVILLAGAIDYTAAANDVLSLLYDGASWHEVSRKLSSANGIAAGSNRDVQINNNGNFGIGGATGDYAFSANGNLLIIRNPTVGTTQSNPSNIASFVGLRLKDSVAATSGNQKFSPAFTLTANGFRTTGAAATQQLNLTQQLRSIQGTTQAQWSYEFMFGAGTDTTNSYVAMALENTSTSSVAAATLRLPGALVVTSDATIDNGGVSTNSLYQLSGSNISFGSNYVGVRTTNTGGANTQNLDGLAIQRSGTYTTHNLFEINRNVGALSSAITATFTNGGTTFSFTNAPEFIRPGDSINVNSVGYRVTAVSGTTVTFTPTFASSTSSYAATIVPTGVLNSFGVSDNGIVRIGQGSWTTFGGAVNLPAGGAYLAPLYFKTGGTLQTTATANTVETDDADLYFTATSTRYKLDKSLSGSATLDFASTGAGAVADLTINVTGAADGDIVSLGVPNGSVTATATFTAWVSAANTVTVRFSPKATEDPASGTFKVRVIK